MHALGREVPREGSVQLILQGQFTHDRFEALSGNGQPCLPRREGLLPVNDQAISLELAADGQSPGLPGQGSVFEGVRAKLVEDQCQGRDGSPADKDILDSQVNRR